MTTRTQRLYLDHNASAPLLPEAHAAIVDALALTGNPSSVHAEGRAARAVLEGARRSVAALVGADGDAVLFTSGATEAAATCLTPHWRRDGEPLTLSKLAVVDTDHPATREGGRFGRDQITRLAVDAAGQVSMKSLDEWLGTIGAGETAMLCMSLANSETGVVQSLAPVRQRLAGWPVMLVLDVVQAAGRRVLDIAALGAQALLLSGHKIGAAKGIGACVLGSASLRPMPLITGGGQEQGRRAGTESLPLIAGFGAAAAVAASRQDADRDRLLGLRERLVRGLAASCPRSVIIGLASERLPNTLAVSSPGLRAETLQIALDLEGIAVSSGSACSSGKVGPSHVLAAMRDGGLEIDALAGAIRISFGYETTQDEIDRCTEVLSRTIARGNAGHAGLRAA